MIRPAAEVAVVGRRRGRGFASAEWAVAVVFRGEQGLRSRWRGAAEGRRSFGNAPLLVVVACAAVFAGCRPQGEREVATQRAVTLAPEAEAVGVSEGQPDAPDRISLVSRVLPQPRPSDYLGSAACVDCHAEIAALYASHPMSQSFNAVDDARPIEVCPAEQIAIPGVREYRVSREGDNVLHHESLRADDGELIYDQGEAVAFAVGSGKQGRAYLLNRDGVLYQSPLGWYSAAGRWDLSPGYAPESHRRFQRRIGDGCLYCHVGRAAAAGEDRYEAPFFPEPSIGCERCHGPGGGHVAFQRRRAERGGDARGLVNPSASPNASQSAERPTEEPDAGEPATDPIVNPAKLDVARREDVCNQCHLQGKHVIRRFGREFFDFRPGDRLEDVFVVLTGGDRLDDQGRHQVVSHVEQMRSSRCYLGSDQMLGCTSCHDPHFQPPPEQQAAWYRDKCFKCHDDQACSLPLESQLQAPASGSCVHCHMAPLGTTNVPHTAQTDHRILRQPGRPTESQVAPVPRAGDVLAVFDGAEERLPGWEVARARGISKMTEAWDRRDERLSLEARRLLVPEGVDAKDLAAVITALGPDQAALAELGSSYLVNGEIDPARVVWRRLLDLNPDHEVALGGLAFIELQRRNVRAGRIHLERLLTLLPNDPEWHARMAELAWAGGTRDEALRAAERVLELDPTKLELRQWLVAAYRSTGNAERSAHHRRIVDQMRQRASSGR